MRSPDAFWDFYRNVLLYPNAQPNAAHIALTRLEKRGKLRAVVTQNIDGLHQAAGTRRVIELHGTVHRNHCRRCDRMFSLADVLAQAGTPRCPCGGLIRPDIVMYGEPLDGDVIDAAIDAIRACDLLIVGGTSLVVQPAAGLLGYRRGAKLALLNRDETPYDGVADVVIRDNLATVLDAAIPEEGQA